MNIEIDEELLEHDIIDLDGISVLCPRLLASDVAQEIYIDWYEDGNVPTDYVIARCYDKLHEIAMEMTNHIEEILQDNDMWLA